MRVETILKVEQGGDLGLAEVGLVEGVVVSRGVIEDGAALDALEVGREVFPLLGGLGRGLPCLRGRRLGGGFLTAAGGEEKGAEAEGGNTQGKTGHREPPWNSKFDKLLIFCYHLALTSIKRSAKKGVDRDKWQKSKQKS